MAGQKIEKRELNMEEAEKVSAGSCLGHIWNKSKKKTIRRDRRKKMRRTALTDNQMTQVNGGSFAQTIDDAKELRSRGIGNVPEPRVATQSRKTALLGPTIASILVERGYKYVYVGSPTDSNQYYDKNGQLVDRATFWANFE